MPHTIPSVALGNAAVIADKAVKGKLQQAVATIPSSYLIVAGAVAAAIAITACAFVAGWMPADLVGTDLISIDAAKWVELTNMNLALPAASERSWRVDEEWMVARDRPQHKRRANIASPVEFLTQIEYLSPVSRSRYVLDITASRTGS